MIIALTGNDGSGKTTLKKLLVERLSKSESVAALEEFDYPTLRLLRRLSGSKAAKIQQDIQQQKPGLATKLLPYIMLWDTTWQTIFHKLAGGRKTFVKDRCLYDYLASWRELGVSTRLVELLYRHAPKPDVTFYISVDPLVSRARRSKQTEKDQVKSTEFYESKAKLYDRIYANSRITRIDNNGTVLEAAETVEHYLRVRSTFKKLRQVALSGLDGAGKSTTMENLSQVLTRLNLSHKTVHFYYNYLPLRLLNALRKKTEDKKVSSSAQHEKSVEAELQAVNKGKSKLWMRLVLADAFLQYFFYRAIYFRRVLLFDRFFPDYMISFDFLKVNYDKRSLEKVFPRTDLYFLQIADYEVLYRRKPEHTLSFFKECHDKYRSLATEQKMIVLDSTDNAPEAILKQLLSAAVTETHVALSRN